MEVWKPCVDCDKYEVSSLGRVRRIKTGRILKAHDNWHGYLVVSLFHNGECVTSRVHRLVAKAFHGNRGSEFMVNHKNGNKHDNTPSNLEWCSHSENRKHAIENGLIPRHSPGSVYAK
jgi:hypothetical protein